MVYHYNLTKAIISTTNAMKDLKITTIQTDIIWENSLENRNRFENEYLSKLSTGETDLILFPEMSMISETPEITTKCWSILGVDPVNMMCADSRMIVKRKEDRLTHVVACTLIPYENDFSYGKYLKDSFKKVYLKHPHCSKFCVLGGASCSNN